VITHNYDHPIEQICILPVGKILFTYYLQNKTVTRMILLDENFRHLESYEYKFKVWNVATNNENRLYISTVDGLDAILMTDFNFKTIDTLKISDNTSDKNGNMNEKIRKLCFRNNYLYMLDTLVNRILKLDQKIVYIETFQFDHERAYDMEVSNMVIGLCTETYIYFYTLEKFKLTHTYKRDQCSISYFNSTFFLYNFGKNRFEIFNQYGEIIEMQARNGIFDKIFNNEYNKHRDVRILFSNKYYLINHNNKILEIRN
jgi:hypothetical protein